MQKKRNKFGAKIKTLEVKPFDQNFSCVKKHARKSNFVHFGVKNGE